MGFLEYCTEDIRQFFAGLDEILFIPYARPGGISYDEYTELVRPPFEAMGIRVRSIHEAASPRVGIEGSEGVFVGGGNTFLLLHSLYAAHLVDLLRERVQGGLRYMGSSAGSNVACQSISTTNDMPIIYPHEFESLGLVPFNINPHYLDPDPGSKHQGETRETRIREFHCYNDQPVLGLREGSWLRLDGERLSIGGPHSVRLFRKGQEAVEIPPDQELSFLIG